MTTLTVQDLHQRATRRRERRAEVTARLARSARMVGVFLRGPRRPAMLGFGALACYVAAGMTISLTVGLVLGGIGLTLMDWRFSAKPDATGGDG
jgi:hypothetical protein